MDFRKLFARWFKTLRLTLLVVSPCFLSIAIGLAIGNAIFVRQSVEADGVVVDLVAVHSDHDGTLTYAPVFTFTAADGRSQRITANISSNPPEFAVGERVRLLYKLRDPSGAKIDTFGQLWGFAVAFGIASAVTGAFGLLLFRAREWRKRHGMAWPA